MKHRSRSRKPSSNDMSTVGGLDVFALIAAVGILIAAAAVPHINEPPKDLADKTTPTEPIPLFIELRWEEKAPHDVDTWVTCTARAQSGVKHTFTVSYKQRHAGWLDLVWDDLGGPSAINYERVVSNSNIERIPPLTSCTINSHLYNSHGGKLPVKGTLVVVLDKDSPTEYAVTPRGGLKFEIVLPGEEVSLMTMVWDRNGHLVRDVVHEYPKVALSCIATSTCN